MVWIARDAEDNLALFFDTSSDGAVPTEAIDYPELEFLEGISDMPWRAAPIYDRESFTRPDALHHVPFWERDTGPLLMFVDDEAAAREIQRRFNARVLPSTKGVALEVGRVNTRLFRQVHRSHCRGCFYPPRVFGADRGFFVYEHATPGVPGPYVRRQFPRRPIKRSSLSVLSGLEPGEVEFEGLRFADVAELQPLETVECRSPGIYFSLQTRAFRERNRRLGASAEDHRRCARRVPGLAGGIRLDRQINVDSDTDPGVPQHVWLTLADAAEAGPTWDLSWPEPEALEQQFGLEVARELLAARPSPGRPREGLRRLVNRLRKEQGQFEARMLPLLYGLSVGFLGPVWGIHELAYLHARGYPYIPGEFRDWSRLLRSLPPPDRRVESLGRTPRDLRKTYQRILAGIEVPRLMGVLESEHDLAWKRRQLSKLRARGYWSAIPRHLPQSDRILAAELNSLRARLIAA